MRKRHEALRSQVDRAARDYIDALMRDHEQKMKVVTDHLQRQIAAVSQMLENSVAAQERMVNLMARLDAKIDQKDRLRPGVKRGRRT